MNELALFAGAGGGILGGILRGWKTVCAVELDAYARDVLVARQNDGCLDPFPIWDDVCTFDGKPWKGIVDVVSGGFPCQDISPAGKCEGLAGAKSGLWREMSRIIGEVRPRCVFVENSADLVVRGLGDVLGDLASMGYHARWGVLGANAIGAPHNRERTWIAAHADAGELRASGATDPKGRATNLHLNGVIEKRRLEPWWAIQPEPCSVVYGVPGVVDRLRPFGNAQVPEVASIAWEILGENVKTQA